MDKQLSNAMTLRWDSPVAVVGGSLAGPAAAAFLRHQGFENVTVYEAAPKSVSRAGGAIRLGRATLAALDQIGITREDVVPFPSDHVVRLRVAGKAEVERVLVPAGGDNSSWTEVHNALAVALPDGTIRHGKRVTGFGPGSNGHAVLEFEDGDTARARMLVFADGRRSLARRRLDPERNLEFWDHVLFRGQSEDPGLGLEGFHLCKVEPSARLVMAPVRMDGRRAVDWTLTLPMQEDVFRAQFGGAPTVRTFVTGDGIGEEATRTLEDAAAEILPDHMAGLIFDSVRRTALPLIGIAPPEQMVFDVGGAIATVIGDALAPVHHVTARGANNGLGEAAGLAAALAAHVRDGEPLDGALAAWERTWLALVTRTIAGRPRA